jgi:glutathione peroxidase
MKWWMTLLTVIVTAGCVAENKELPMANLYEIEVNRITGEPVTLSAYEGKTLLIVNTASRCGFTGQYEGLQDLYETYKNRGFTVLGFPSNNFMGQEPGSNEEIASFCSVNYGVTFPMFEKIDVKGKNQHPLYTYLTSSVSNPGFAGKISWNFNKFLISADGRVIGRFGSRTSPDDKKLIAAIEEALPES